MANPRPWFPFYVADFLLDEAVMLCPPEAVGVYVRLLCHQWREGSLPGDRPELAEMARVSQKVFAKCWVFIGAKFEKVDGRLVNERLNTEREKAIAKSKAGGMASRGSRPDSEQRFLYAASALGYLSRYDGSESARLVKIGWSRTPSKRIRSLDHPSLIIEQVKLIGQVPASLALERRAHIDLAHHLQTNEWFNDTPEVRGWLVTHGVTAGHSNGDSIRSRHDTYETSRTQSESESESD